MGKPLAKKQGLKRRKPANRAEDVKKKQRKIDDDKAIQDSSSPISAGTLSSEEDDVPNKPLAFDSLLKQLGSESDRPDGSYTKRQKEGEARSDSEGDEDGDFGSPNTFDEENGELHNESSLDDAEGDSLRQYKPSHIKKQSEEDETEDESSSGDEGSGFESDSPTNVDETTYISSFHRHMRHVLTNEDADKLMKSKWKYKWEMPATAMILSKWVGTGEHLSAEVSSELVYGIKPKLYKHWLEIYKASSFPDLNSQLRFFFSLCNSYRDIMHCNKKPFYLKREEDSIIMDAYLMHAINHVFKTRDTVSKNNTKLTREQQSKEEEILNSSSFLDHGFTRPKIEWSLLGCHQARPSTELQAWEWRRSASGFLFLNQPQLKQVMFLLPLGSIALRVVKRLIQLIPASNKTNVEHIDRFSKEFGTCDIQEDDESSKTKPPAKPKDFERLFGGNNNDHFMIGIKLTKRSIKLYNDFYSSDIIVASPLGLVTKIGDTEAEKGKDVDYLSSIEVLIIDHADVIAMQNWSHLNTVVEQLNHTPSKQHGTDVMRIRQWYLDGHARFYRQTVVLGSFLNPDMNALFNRSCVNYEGKVKLISEYKGVLPKVLLQVRQVYDRFDASSIVDVDDARLDYFCKKVFPKIKDSVEGGIMIFISSYFEYVRIRNFMTSQNASFCVFGDYAEPSDISRARVWFFEGKRKIMLYTERAHFYHRYKIRGIKNLLIYSLPEREEFYPEIINMLEGSNNMICNVLFSRFDHLRLERIVGTSAAKRMVSSDKKMFVFC